MEIPDNFNVFSPHDALYKRCPCGFRIGPCAVQTAGLKIPSERSSAEIAARSSATPAQGAAWRTLRATSSAVTVAQCWLPTAARQQVAINSQALPRRPKLVLPPGRQAEPFPTVSARP